METLCSICRRKLLLRTASMQPDAGHLHSLICHRLVMRGRSAHAKESVRRANARVASRLWLHGAICFAAARVLFDNTSARIGFSLLCLVGYVVCYRLIARPAEGTMRVELTIDGGFAYIPGLATPMVLEGAQLAGDDLARLRRLCQAALATPNRDATTQPAALPDARCYRLTLEIDGERHALTATDPVSQPAVAELIGFVTARGRR